jgi:LysM repeat protein
MSGVAIPLLIVGAAATSFAWNALQARANTPSGSIVNTGGNQQSPFWSLFTGTAVPRSTATTISRTIPPLTNCPLPDGWMPYLVAPTDSLYRLSIIYGVPVANLQRVNCMDDTTAILPGQIIYVPVLPTSTPSLTPTLVPVAPVIAPPDNGGSDKPRPTPRPPTAVPKPPTPVPPTAVPPTAIVEPPPKDDPTPRVKPTKKPKDSGNSGSDNSEVDPPDNKKKGKKGKDK